MCCWWKGCPLCVAGRRGVLCVLLIEGVSSVCCWWKGCPDFRMAPIQVVTTKYNVPMHVTTCITMSVCIHVPVVKHVVCMYC